MNKPLFLSTILFAACDTSMTGSQGNLELSYTHGGLFEQVSRPVAAGLQADTVIRNATTTATITIANAASSDTAVIDVLATDGERMDLIANSAGQATLSVTTDTGVHDEFSVDVRDIASISFENPTFTGDRDNFVIGTGASIWLPRSLTDESGTTLTGYGLTLPDATPVENAIALEDGAIGSTQVQFFLPGDVEIGSTGNPGTTFTVVDIAEIDWNIEMVDGYEGSLPIGASGLVQVSGTDSLGRTALSNIISADDTVCSVSDFLGSADSYIVSASAAGECVLVLPGAADVPVLTYTVLDTDA